MYHLIQTMTYKGQWLLVVKSNKVQKLTQYIKRVLPEVYTNKAGKQPKLVTHQTPLKTTIYKFKMMDKTMSTVSTYAEILTKRFIEKTHTTKNTSNHKDTGELGSTSSKSQRSNDDGRSSNRPDKKVGTGGVQINVEIPPPTDKYPVPKTDTNQTEKQTITLQENRLSPKKK